MYVIKRDGSKEGFNSSKIKEAIFKAFRACNQELSLRDKQNLSDFCEDIGSINKDIPVEDIQDMVEKVLMGNKAWFKVAKSYIL